MGQPDLEGLVILLQSALSHLYDPLYSMPEALCIALQHSSVNLPRVLIGAIHAMAPDETVPLDSPAQRYHQLLRLRYIEGLTQKAAAERLGISDRYLRDLQRLSVEALAIFLLSLHKTPITTGLKPPDTSQVARELAALKESAPGETAMVASAIHSAILLLETIDLLRDVSIHLCDPVDHLGIAMHPSVLKQVILSSFERLARCMDAGRINVYAEQLTAPDKAVQIRLVTEPAISAPTCDLSMVDEIITPYGGQVHITPQDDATVVNLSLPAAQQEQLLVLVIDDNDDLVAFYRAYVIGTGYEIVQAREGSAAIPLVEARRPDLIILDVMLPDINGWELLVRLREHPASSRIPVVVCSVIRDEDLARDLGAVEFVPKPVGRQAFLAALDRALTTV